MPEEFSSSEIEAVYRVIAKRRDVRHFVPGAVDEASMSRKGNCHDNAVAESFFSNLKNEVMHERFFATCDEAKAVINEYIEVYYNRMRVHQTLGYQTPAQVE